jgi:glycosyltransferase involved in cell wall biosynthesis
MACDLSLILPAYNSANYIVDSIERSAKFLSALGLNYELIIVNDGSLDGTKTTLDKLSLANVKILHLDKNTGKYGALKKAVESSSGTVVIFTDSDLPYGLEPVSVIYNAIKNRQATVVIGDRTHPQSSSLIKQNKLRKLTSKLLATMIWTLSFGKFSDTQCGIKGLEGKFARDNFPKLKDNRYGGDVELLFLASKQNQKILQIPVCFQSNEASNLNLLTDGVTILLRVLLTAIRTR